ncbi:Deoxyribonuclease-1-like 2 [Taenia crassiceps]|uniref:Deoxyribonuclease-1-like 2 n=1 Tax=Taenia crassiceps TaxID=6207 RepID=A0ABR4QBJ9_9CEST
MLSLPLLLLLVVCLLGLPAPSEEKVKVAGFNVQVFGKRKSKDSEVMDILAKIIGGYDGVFVQEIRDSSGKAFPELLNTVSAASGATYRGLMGPRKGRSSSKEQIGFVYRPDKIQLVGLFPMLNKSTSFERPPDCFAFIIKEGGLRVAVLAVHISPRSVKAEMEALYNVAPVCQTFAGTQNLILLGDMNADCGYLPARDRHKLRLRTDHQYKWLIEDGADTTVAASRCAYDRVIVKGDELARRTSSARPNNFEKVYKLPLSKAKRVSDHYPIEFEINEIWGLPQKVIESAKLCSDDRVRVLDEISMNRTSLQEKRPRLEEETKEGNDVITLPLGFVRHEWPEVGDLPKQILVQHCKRSRIAFPTYSTVEDKASRTFLSIVTVNGASYSHKIASTTKRFAEQAAALACITHLGIWTPK